jgi:hypothetical protein
MADATADKIAPNQEMTFTVTRAPRTTAAKKTLERLMGMQTSIQRGRKKLHTQRRLRDNVTYIRAGRKWVNRARATKLATAEPGNSFTLHVTPQMINDLRSVAGYLSIG